MKTITVLGAGAFGTAIAQLLAENCHTVTLWCYEATVATTIQQQRINQRYLPGVVLHERITATTSLHEAAANAIIFEAIPVAHLRTVLLQIRPLITMQHQWVVLSKGMEIGTCLLPSELIKQFFPEHMVAVLCGPSYAKEVAAQQPTQVTCAAETTEFAQTVQKLVTNQWFTTEISYDMRGVQLCAAYKNVAAIYLGMLEGAGAGENSRAQALLHCLQELQLLLTTAGADAMTAYSPAGLGDLIVTCYGALSRNRLLGVQLGKGHTLEQILAELGTVPEGLNSVCALQQWAQKNTLTLAICTMVHESLDLSSIAGIGN